MKQMSLTFPKPDRKAEKARKDARRLASRQKFTEGVLAADRGRCRNFLRVHNGYNTGGIEAHHIIYRGSLALDSVENGISLCADCHRRVHNGHRDMSGRAYMLWIIDQLKDFPDFRWAQARAELQKSVDRKNASSHTNNISL